MTMTRTIGGNRLGSGKKMTVDMKTYERSTHDLSYIWRSTMASGTLVPFLKELALPGDTFDINLDCDIMTHPTVGPLFGSFKVQLDVFMAPIRLYQGKLHNNKLGIGMNMAAIKLPQIYLTAANIDWTQENIDNQQINPSSIFAYLGIRGLGHMVTDVEVGREFNAIPYLAYWDIYKNYYANKQEEIGAVIHASPELTEQTVDDIDWITAGLGSGTLSQAPVDDATPINASLTMNVNYTGTAPIPAQIMVSIDNVYYPLTELFAITNVVAGIIYCNGYTKGDGTMNNWRYATATDVTTDEPQVYTFPLSNLDDMREEILADVASPTAFIVDLNSIEPYNLPILGDGVYPQKVYAKLSPQEGLAIKTYQSDLFNNWIQTEWIDGVDGISAITAVDTSGGSFTIDQLNLQKKVYDMLNRIAISGGTYDDWQETVYTHESFRRAETPMYMGGLIKELIFQEVVSNSESAGELSGSQPLGTLAGKGRLSSKHKGGNVTIKVDEPSYIIGIISLTPRIDYSQGNKWDTNLQNMDQLHKPALDEIGFQDLTTDQMTWWDTDTTVAASPIFKSAGKQPAWIQYMTNINQVLGNFAIQDNEMFMTLNRRYEPDADEKTIKDLTTYIDPVKFNHIFAQTSRDAQNFWTQIGVDITARRKMSARIIPNL